MINWKEKYDLSFENEEERNKCRLFRIILVNEYYKFARFHLLLIKNYQSLVVRKPFNNDLIEPYESFKNEIRKHFYKMSSQVAWYELDEEMMKIYQQLHYKNIKKSDSGLLGVLIANLDDYPKLIKTIAVFDDD